MVELIDPDDGDLQNARPLDVHRWSDYLQVNNFIDESRRQDDRCRSYWASQTTPSSFIGAGFICTIKLTF